MSTNRTTLIEVGELAACLAECIVIDCRHDLSDPARGREAWMHERIPGAFFLSQDDDLAGPRTGRNGRHPLPDRARLRSRLQATGWSDGVQLVAYDERDGMCAARLWWLARWLGQERVAVLDGGLAAWRHAGQALEHGDPFLPAASPATSPAPATTGMATRAADDRSRPLVRTVDADALLAGLNGGHPRCIVDARSAERWRGEVEPFDPVAGHIPGSLNRPHLRNLLADGRFKPAAQLRAEFLELLGKCPPDEVVHHCGSGITACHNLLAMEIAGLRGSALYPGSWSEWCADPARPVATAAGQPG